MDPRRWVMRSPDLDASQPPPQNRRTLNEWCLLRSLWSRLRSVCGRSRISDGFCIGTWVSVSGPATSRSRGLGLPMSREFSGNVGVHILGEQGGVGGE